MIKDKEDCQESTRAKIKQEYTTKTQFSLIGKRYWDKYTWKHVKLFIPHILLCFIFLFFPLRELYTSQIHAGLGQPYNVMLN